jgi:hypothetical protein
METGTPPSIGVFSKSTISKNKRNKIQYVSPRYRWMATYACPRRRLPFLTTWLRSGIPPWNILPLHMYRLFCLSWVFFQNHIPPLNKKIGSIALWPVRVRCTYVRLTDCCNVPYVYVGHINASASSIRETIRVAIILFENTTFQIIDSCLYVVFSY